MSGTVVLNLLALVLLVNTVTSQAPVPEGCHEFQGNFTVGNGTDMGLREIGTFPYNVVIHESAMIGTITNGGGLIIENLFSGNLSYAGINDPPEVFIGT